MLLIDFFLSILSRLFVRLATKKSSSAIAVEALEIDDEGLEVEMLPAIDIGGSLWVVLLSVADSILPGFSCFVLS